MSYCRWMEGDVYMILRDDDSIECVACQFGRPGKMFNGSVTLKTKHEALKHLNKHKKAGHSVPDHAVNRLQEEIREEDNATTL